MTTIPEILDFFSNLTQNTLSAFHLSDDDSDLYEQIENIKRLLRSVKKRKLVTATQLEDGTFERIFTDGHTDIVTRAQLKQDSYYDSKPEHEFIREILESKHSAITSLKLNPKIEETEWIEINTPIEKLFFYSQNCTDNN